MLTDVQFQHYQTFGFIVLRDFFTQDEVGILRNEFEEELNLVYEHEPFTGETRYWTVMLHPRTPLFYSLLEDKRFCSVAEQIYGNDVIGIMADANRYVGNTRRHPDHDVAPDRDCYGVKFAFYLDAVDGKSGALRLIPGSHNRQYHEDLKSSLKDLDLEVDGVPAYVCVSNPGDVVAFDMRCWHSSSGGTSGRRMSTCVYYKNPQGQTQEAAARTRARSSVETPSQFGRKRQPMFSRKWISNIGGSTKRQRWLNRMAEFGYFRLPVEDGA